MSFGEYLRDKLFCIFIFICTMFLSGTILWLIEIKTIFIIFIECPYLVGFLCIFMWDFYRKKKYYNQLWKTFDQLDDKTLIGEIISAPYFLDGKILYQFLRCSNKYLNDSLANADTINQEYREYIEMWVHEVKTPITSAHLMVENDKNITTLHIDSELLKIERFVEQALFYARSTTLEKDFKVEKTTLKTLVHKAVKNYSKPIIQVRGELKFENLDIPVCADSKWCTFIIGQVIANSVKYVNENLKLTFEGGEYNNGCYLIIRDNGIGISTVDLPCIFDKGFTGENGRKYTKSTGIGLYLCKKLCEKMNMDISVSSKLGEGTTLKITFPKGTYYFEQA